MSLRILHVFDHSLPLHSGYTFRSRAIIAEQRKLGWQTIHVTSAKHPSRTTGKESTEGLVFHRTQPGPLNKWPAIGQWDVVHTLTRRIKGLLQEHPVDLIHAHSPSLNGLAAIRAGRQMKLPVVYEVRAFWEDAAVDHGTAAEGSLRYRGSRALETYVLRRASQVTCICEGLRQDIVARSGVASGAVTVIPNAVDLTAFPALDGRDAGLASQLGLTSAKVLGFIGSFYHYEGLDLLLDAMPLVLSSRPDTRLLLVGGGPQQPALEKQAERLGIAGKVIFTGRVPQEQVPGLSSLVDCFVFPRKSIRLTELVTPLKPLEAMAQRRLVMASDIGGHRELIQHGRTGLLFRHDDVGDLARSITDMLAHPADYSGIIDAARDYVEAERSWAVTAQGYRSVYGRAVNGQVSSRSVS